MGTHPYCIVPAGHRPTGELVGIGDRPVEYMDTGALGVWMSSLDRAPEPNLPALRTHEAVGRAAARSGLTPLPLRFGGWVEDARTLTDGIHAREADFLQALEDLAGMWEVGLRIVETSPLRAAGEEVARRDPPTPLQEGPGRAYLDLLADRRSADRLRMDASEQALADFRTFLGTTVKDEMWISLQASDGLLSVAQLVHEGDIETWKEGVRHFRESRPDLRVFELGPWLPYSFAP